MGYKFTDCPLLCTVGVGGGRTWQEQGDALPLLRPSPYKGEGNFFPTECILKPIFSIFTWSLLALTLALAFPGIRLDWLALLSAAAFARAGFFFAFFTAAILAWIFSTFSLVPAWQLLIPLGLGLAAFYYLNRRLNAEGSAAPVLLFLLLGFDGLLLNLFSGAGWSSWGPWGMDLIWAGITWVCGVLIFPQMRRLAGAMLVWIFSRLKRPRQVSFLRSATERKTGHYGRRPFGLEKGM